MLDSPTFVIIGAGLAGGRASETLRQLGFDGRIVLVGAEPDRPYERPPLSKTVLLGTKPAESVFLRPASYYDEQRIELLLGCRAIGIDPDNRRVRLSTGDAIRYDKLLIATGASLRRLNVPGADLPGIFSLRTLVDAQALRSQLVASRKVVLVGGGFIGLEVAAVCRQAGLEVTVLEMLPVPLGPILGDAVGERIVAAHRARGVEIRTGTAVSAFEGNGRVERVIASNGVSFDCDFAVVGVGVVPEVGWLAGSGIAIDNGIVVDEHCRSTLPDVYAAGDVANWPHAGRRLRTEHYDHAQNQGVAAAKAMLDTDAPYAALPFFWSDQYDLVIQHVGHNRPDDDIVFRGSDESWSAFYLRDHQLVAALTVNRLRDTVAARQLITRRTEVSATALADETVDLRALARASS